MIQTRKTSKVFRARLSLAVLTGKQSDGSCPTWSATVKLIGSSYQLTVVTFTAQGLPLEQGSVWYPTLVSALRDLRKVPVSILSIEQEYDRPLSVLIAEESALIESIDRLERHARLVAWQESGRGDSWIAVELLSSEHCSDYPCVRIPAL